MDEVSATIAAPPERVWSLITDISRMGDWSPGCTGGRWTKGATGPAKGARFIGTNRHGPIRWVTHCQVVECDKPHRFVFEVAENKTQWGWKLEPTEDGGTKLTQWRTRIGKPNLLVRTFAQVVFRGRLDEVIVDGMRQTVAAIKAELEQSPASA